MAAGVLDTRSLTLSLFHLSFATVKGGLGRGRGREQLAVDQLLNAVYLFLQGAEIEPILDEALFQTLTGAS